MKNYIVAFIKDENGQTSTEYILLIAVVAMIVMKMKGTLQQKLDGVLTTSFGTVDRELQTMGE